MPQTHAQLKVGTDNPRYVRELQAILNSLTGAGLEIDGIFGPKTLAAVKSYQKANYLEPDGIVGIKTWTSLLSGQPAQGEDNPAERYGISDRMEDAQAAYEEYLQTADPGSFHFANQQELDRAWREYETRKAFSYDAASDPMYRQYRDQYIRAGRTAMEDTVGKAAALTGGYGNSYAQTAGQQTYNTHLQKLTGVIPQLYQLALDKYRQEGKDLLEIYEHYRQAYDRAYDQHQQKKKEFQAQADALYDQVQQAEKDTQTQYTRLSALIKAGYFPTDSDLRRAGMTRLQANALAGGSK